MKQYDYIKALLKNQQRVTFKALGHSMEPTVNHEETVTLFPFDPIKDTIKLYDIVFVEINGMYKLHRVIYIEPLIKIKGDSDDTIDIITKAQMLGVFIDPLIHHITSYIKKTKPLDMTSMDLKRHNLEGLYPNHHALNQAYLMEIEAREVKHVMQLLKDYLDDIVILKGYALSHLYQDNPYIRAKGDLDLYVMNYYHNVTNILLLHGYLLQSKSYAHDTYFNGVLAIEIHHHLDFEFKIKDTMLTQDDTYQAKRLNDTYQLIYLLLHIKKHLNHGGIGFKHIRDMYTLKAFKSDLLVTYQVDRVFEYCLALFDFMLGNKIKSSIKREHIILLIKDIKRYGAHGNMKLRLHKLKDSEPLRKRYLKQGGLKRLLDTLRHNTVWMLYKKMKVYYKSKPNRLRQEVLKEIL